MPGKFTLISILSLMIFLMTSCTKKDMQKDFVSFDKAYIPALVLTNQGEEASETALAMLKEEWGQFRIKYYESNPKDPNWKKNLDNVELMISKADQIISSHGNLADAHESLEGVRKTFMEMRKRNDMKYYIDYLNEFHEPMEGIILTAKGKNPESLTEADVEKIQRLLDESISIWVKLENAKFDKTLFGFNDENTEELKKSIDLVSESLNALKLSVDAKDRKSIIKSAMEIKPNFVEVFTSFGDFDRIENYRKGK